MRGEQEGCHGLGVGSLVLRESSTIRSKRRGESDEEKSKKKEVKGRVDDNLLGRNNAPAHSDWFGNARRNARQRGLGGNH